MKDLNDPGIDGVCCCAINISNPLNEDKIKPCEYMEKAGIGFGTGMSFTERRRTMVECECPEGSSSPFGIGLIFFEDLSADECIEYWDKLELKKCGRYWELLNFSKAFNELRE
jgi:hypothetical protein